VKSSELGGNRAVITGGVSGIGRAVVFAFAEAGAETIVLELRANDVSRVAQEVSEISGKESTGFACDVADEASVEATFSSIEALGSIDILVNSAGIIHIGTLLTTSAEEMDRLYRVNARGTYLTMRAAVRSMLLVRRGVILNMASIAATAGISERFAYSMSKGAVIAMTLSVAKDYLAEGIHCNCISPARVHTPFVDGFVARNYPGREQEQIKKLAEAQPIGRMGTPEEIALLALFLCPDAASFVTGADYPMDGGFLNLR
jgi:NAD(P)-dependent dehydrogenase (short-subunit alcohol dehydrogenase family)